jgi:hypothetical protein
LSLDHFREINEVINPKSETNPKYQMFKTLAAGQRDTSVLGRSTFMCDLFAAESPSYWPVTVCLLFEFRSFEFVSDFGFRASDLIFFLLMLSVFDK